MRALALAGLDRTRLRLLLGLFFLALGLPTAVLIHQAYGQLKWEALHQQRLLAEALVRRVDGRLAELVGAEEARSFADFAFLVVTGDPAASFVQRSPLSAYPVVSTIPGLIAHFQVDTGGALSTPLLPPAGTDPADYGISSGELAERAALQERVRRILAAHRLVQGGARAPVPGKRKDRAAEPERDGSARLDLSLAPALVDPGAAAPAAEPTAAPSPAQAAFDRLAASAERQEQKAAGAPGRGKERAPQPGLAEALPAGPPAGVTGLSQERRPARRERSALPEPLPPEPARQAEAAAPARLQVATFESEIDPFDFSLLDTEHFVLFRKVWRDGQRHIQGALIARRPFLQAAVELPFRDSALSVASDLRVAYRGQVLAAFPARGAGHETGGAQEPDGPLLHQARLSAPLSEIELVLGVRQLPAGPGGRLIGWLAGTLAVVLCGGLYLTYRLVLRQIELARQQQDFVSAVSHELKTPLTSIRMYGEILREGWASEEQRRTYYEYIYAEAERLSRLIANVLQLARMTRNELRVDLRTLDVAELLEGVRPKLATQAERAGFVLHVDCPEEVGRTLVRADTDFFTQILINLVDNALKFSARGSNRAVDLACRRTGGGVVIAVRDYGPGVPRDQLRKIFRLFYRAGDELTRETVGTGIGLALVRQLTLAMGGHIQVLNRDPGAEFQLVLPAARDTAAG